MNQETPIERTFSDNEGNHLLVALCFYDDENKRDTFHIPEEYNDIEIIDIEITKAYVDKPIHPVVFFRMSAWLLEQFEIHRNAVFTFICSFDKLNTNHPAQTSQTYRWMLFDRLYRRLGPQPDLNIRDVIVGPDGFQSYGRAFYRTPHAPIIHIIASYLQDKQLLY